MPLKFEWLANLSNAYTRQAYENAIKDFMWFTLAHDAASRATFLADAAGYADRFPLTAEQRTTLIALDTRAIVAMGAHPLVPFLAKMQVERQRRG